MMQTLGACPKGRHTESTGDRTPNLRAPFLVTAKDGALSWWLTLEATLNTGQNVTGGHHDNNKHTRNNTT